MKKPVNNITSTSVILGGVEVAAKTQREVRESLITDLEKEAILGKGFVLDFKPMLITVKKAEDAQGTDTQKDTQNSTLEHVAYPTSCINKAGEVSGHPSKKKQVEMLVELYGEKLLSDNDFVTAYPEADIEKHRVEEIIINE